MSTSTKEGRMTGAAGHFLFTCWLAVALFGVASTPLLGQRAWRQGEMWLKWSQQSRNAYMLGYLEGRADDARAGERGSGTLPRKVDNTAQLAQSVTEFYKRYPEDRDIYITEVIEQLEKGLTLDQIHNYPFWRHERPASDR